MASTHPDFYHDSPSCTGVLLSNLGTPDAPTPAALRKYLGEFLWDPRVVEIPRPLWWLILHGVILRTRPRRAARLYQEVWTDAGSPLLAISRRQTEALQNALAQRFKGPVCVALGMRYGNPSLESALNELRLAAARRILVLPLYPQYSATTTASTFDAVAALMRKQRWLPELRFVMQYHDEPDYIAALAGSIREHFSQHGIPDRLLFSFHGIPLRNLHLGDPYHCQCQKTARLVAEKLALEDRQWGISFQSRFGRAEWLQPYTDATLKAWGREGVGHVAVACPGFSADCLETLEEIAVQNREFFLHAGGKRFEYIPALNDRADNIQMLVNLIHAHTGGWPETGADWQAPAAAATLERAKALGATR